MRCEYIVGSCVRHQYQHTNYSGTIVMYMYFISRYILFHWIVFTDFLINVKCQSHRWIFYTKLHPSGGKNTCLFGKNTMKMVIFSKLLLRNFWEIWLHSQECYIAMRWAARTNQLPSLSINLKNMHLWNSAFPKQGKFLFEIFEKKNLVQYNTMI